MELCNGVAIAIDTNAICWNRIDIYDYDNECR